MGMGSHLKYSIATLNVSNVIPFKFLLGVKRHMGPRIRGSVIKSVSLPLAWLKTTTQICFILLMENGIKFINSDV
jgi:hypothetical protein